MTKFTKADIGKRVRLPANEVEGWTEEFGIIEAVHEDDFCVGYSVDYKFRAHDSYMEDGQRETDFDSAEQCPPKFTKEDIGKRVTVFMDFYSPARLEFGVITEVRDEFASLFASDDTVTIKLDNNEEINPGFLHVEFKED